MIGPTVRPPHAGLDSVANACGRHGRSRSRRRAAGHSSGRGAARRPRVRRRPSRRQAVEPAGRRPGQVVGHRLRPGPLPRDERPDANGRRPGHDALHEPRAGAGPGRARSTIAPTSIRSASRCTNWRRSTIRPTTSSDAQLFFDRDAAQLQAAAALESPHSRRFPDDRPEVDRRVSARALRARRRNWPTTCDRFLEGQPILASPPSCCRGPASGPSGIGAVYAAAADPGRRTGRSNHPAFSGRARRPRQIVLWPRPTTISARPTRCSIASAVNWSTSSPRYRVPRACGINSSKTAFGCTNSSSSRPPAIRRCWPTWRWPTARWAAWPKRWATTRRR